MAEQRGSVTDAGAVELTTGIARAVHRLALVAWGCLAYAVLALLGVAQLVQWGSPDVGWLVWWACSLAASLTGLVGCGVAAVVLRALLPVGRSEADKPTDEFPVPGSSSPVS
jgi:hypothetical protein